MDYSKEYFPLNNFALMCKGWYSPVKDGEDLLTTLKHVLALDGYVAIQVGKCYGKYYDPYKYYIQCGTGDLLPERIIVLNGADYTMPSGDAPVDIDAANDIFDKMESVSQTQRSKYFKDN